MFFENHQTQSSAMVVIYTLLKYSAKKILFQPFY